MKKRQMHQKDAYTKNFSAFETLICLLLFYNNNNLIVSLTKHVINCSVNSDRQLILLYFLIGILCDADDNSNVYKYYLKDVQCNSNYGDCDFINHACICHEDFTHDLLYLRQRTCQFPNLYFPIMFGIQLALYFYFLSSISGIENQEQWLDFPCN